MPGCVLGCWLQLCFSFMDGKAGSRWWAAPRCTVSHTQKRRWDRVQSWATGGAGLPTPHGKIANNALFYHCKFNWKEYIQTSLQSSQRERCLWGSVTLVALCVLALAARDLVAPARTELGALCQGVFVPRVQSTSTPLRVCFHEWGSLRCTQAKISDEHKHDIHTFPFLP